MIKNCSSLCTFAAQCIRRKKKVEFYLGMFYDILWFVYDMSRQLFDLEQFG